MFDEDRSVLLLLWITTIWKVGLLFSWLMLVCILSFYLQWCFLTGEYIFNDLRVYISFRRSVYSWVFVIDTWRMHGMWCLSVLHFQVRWFKIQSVWHRFKSFTKHIVYGDQYLPWIYPISCIGIYDCLFFDTQISRVSCQKGSICHV